MAAGHSGHGERVGPGPPGTEKAPLAELSGRDPEPVEFSSLHPHGDHIGRLGDHAFHPQAVTQAAGQRQSDAEAEHAGGDQAPGDPPQERHQRGSGEVSAGPELVRQSQSDAEIGVEVNQVPCLVSEPASGGAQRGDDDGDEAGRTGCGQQHPRIHRHQDPRLPEDPGPGRRRVAEGDRDDVDEHQTERSEAHPAVPSRECVLAPHSFQPGNPCHQQDLHEQEVGTEQSRYPPDARPPSRDAGQGLHPVVTHPERNHQATADQRRSSDEVCEPLPAPAGGGIQVSGQCKA